MKFLQELEGVLKSDERFVSQDANYSNHELATPFRSSMPS